MPITAERLEVDVQANTAKASRDLDQFDRKTKGLTSSAAKMAKGMTAAFSGGAERKTNRTTSDDPDRIAASSGVAVRASNAV